MDRPLDALQIITKQRDELSQAYHNLQVQYQLLGLSLKQTNDLMELAKARIEELEEANARRKLGVVSDVVKTASDADANAAA